MIRKVVNSIEAMTEEKCSEEMLVEVSSHKQGFEGAWFAASIKIN